MPPPAEIACVRCGKPRSPGFAPFCSAGCKDRDLLDWFGERQVIPGDADDALDNPGAEALDNEDARD